MQHTNNHEAVSPVIGVILMVAITVILAAVIAAFVFGMAGQIQTTKTVAVTMTQKDATSVTYTNMGGPDVGQLEKITLSGDIDAVKTPAPLELPITTGGTKTITTTALAGSKHIVVVGTFKDGTEQVLLDTYITRSVP